MLRIPSGRKYSISFAYLSFSPSSVIIPKPDTSKTPNDFGFHKRSFDMVFAENEIRKLKSQNIEKRILEIAQSIVSKDAEKTIESKLKAENTPAPKTENLSADHGYVEHTRSYMKFMSDYLKDRHYRKDEEALTDHAGNPKRMFEYGQEVINSEERKTYMRSAIMNSIMNAPNNPIDPDKAQEFEYWKIASKFNQLLSFMLYDNIMMLQ